MPEYFTLVFSVEIKAFVLSQTELCLSGLSGWGLGDRVKGCSSFLYQWDSFLYHTHLSCGPTTCKGELIHAKLKKKN